MSSALPSAAAASSEDVAAIAAAAAAISASSATTVAASFPAAVPPAPVHIDYTFVPPFLAHLLNSGPAPYTTMVSLGNLQSRSVGALYFGPVSLLYAGASSSSSPAADRPRTHRHQMTRTPWSYRHNSCRNCCHISTHSSTQSSSQSSQTSSSHSSTHSYNQSSS
jgi:hypothetical protein